MPLLRRPTPNRPRARFNRPGRGLVASAERATESQGAVRRLDQAWQQDAMRTYRTQGECWNPAQYQARAMERIRYFPAIRDERGVPQEVESGPLLDLFNRIQTPNGGPGDLSEIAGSYARLQFVIGDGLLTVSADDDEEVWEYLSPMEMRLWPQADGTRQEYRRLRAPGITAEELTEAPDDDFEPTGIDQARVWRLWRRHPEYSQWSDSPVRPILDIYTLLERLTLAVAAEASSRAAQRGLLFIPDELSFGPADSTQEENPEEDPLIREFQETMARAIREPGSAEAMSPFIMRAPGVQSTSAGNIATKDLIAWIALGPSDRYLEGEMWDRTISRLAGSLDLPKEMMTGIEDVSHWSAWFLDEVGFRQHTGPTVVRFCGDIAASYLRPAARAEGIENADRVTMWFDPSEAVNHPDETGVVAAAHKALVVSDKYYRTKIGAAESDAPDQEELDRRTLVLLKQVPADMEDEVAVASGGETPPPDGGRGGDVNEGPPAGTTERPAGDKAPSPRPSMVAMMTGAAVMQIDRARELAGNRLVRLAQTCGECQEKIDGTKASLVAATLGSEQVRTFLAEGKSEQDLVRGVGLAYADRLRQWDINGGWPDTLGQMVEQHARRTLYETEVPGLPSSFVAACQRAVNGTES